MKPATALAFQHNHSHAANHASAERNSHEGHVKGCTGCLYASNGAHTGCRMAALCEQGRSNTFCGVTDHQFA